MDSNPVAPFNMYSDEFILCMENEQKEIKTRKNIISEITLFSFLALAGISVFIIFYFVFDLKLIVSVIFPSIFLGLPLIGGLLAGYVLHKPKSLYYVTNYRLITLTEGKKPIVRFSYIKSLTDIDIITNSHGEASIEFEWGNLELTPDMCHGFFNINNTHEVYCAILEQKEILHNRTVHLDIIPQ